MNRWAIVGSPCRDKEEPAVEAKVVCVSIFAECHAIEALACRLQRGVSFFPATLIPLDRRFQRQDAKGESWMLGPISLQEFAKRENILDVSGPAQEQERKSLGRIPRIRQRPSNRFDIGHIVASERVRQGVPVFVTHTRSAVLPVTRIGYANSSYNGRPASISGNGRPSRSWAVRSSMPSAWYTVRAMSSGAVGLSAGYSACLSLLP